MSDTRAASVDIAEFIDAQPIGRFQAKLVLTCAAVLFADGFDTQAIGYVAPELSRVWSLPRGALGPVFSAGLIGLMIGALLLSPLADRVGRKRIIVASTAAFGIGTLATVLAYDTTSLIVIRFLTGLGLGGAMPNSVALTAEFSPHRRRATLVMLAFCGFSVGAALGGLIAAVLVPHFGWQSVFVIGGLGPLLLTPYLALRLPESVRFLALARGADATVAQSNVAHYLARVFPDARFPPGTRFAAHEEGLEGVPVVQLFTHGRTVVTALLWVVFFMSLLDLYFLSNWLPTVMNDLGASVSLAAVIGSMLQVGGFIGVLILGRFMDRFSFNGLGVIYGLAALCIAAIGYSSHSVPVAMAVIFATGFCVVGAQTAANALVAHYYPTALRSTGVGWALGIGRVGSIVGPLVGGTLLAMRWDTHSLFLAAAVPAVVAALASFAVTGAIGAQRRAAPAGSTA